MTKRWIFNIHDEDGRQDHLGGDDKKINSIPTKPKAVIEYDKNNKAKALCG